MIWLIFISSLINEKTKIILIILKIFDFLKKLNKFPQKFVTFQTTILYMTEENVENLKVIIVGSYSIGKTALIKRFYSNAFSEDHEATVQAEMKSITLTNEFKQEKVVLNVWDTAGEERFESLAPIFFKNSQVAFVCFDFQDETSKNKIDTYVKIIESSSPDCVIYLVATRIDKTENNDEISEFLKAKINEISTKYPGFTFYTFQTSAKSGEGVNELFQHVANADISAKGMIDIDINERTNVDDQKKCC